MPSSQPHRLPSAHDAGRAVVAAWAAVTVQAEGRPAAAMPSSRCTMATSGPANDSAVRQFQQAKGLWSNGGWQPRPAPRGIAV